MLDFKKKSKNLISFKNQKNAELNESRLKILIERWFNANLKLICNVCEHLVTNKTSIGGGTLNNRHLESISRVIQHYLVHGFGGEGVGGGSILPPMNTV